MLTLVGLLVAVGVVFVLAAVLTVAVFGSDHGRRTIVDDED
ncbi:hypothetical protein ACQEVB_02725 [Pseudonocardia sp. CA-107938]